MEKLQKAFALFDAYNKRDQTVISWQKKTYPSEYFYALKLYNWVITLQPAASEMLQAASRCQHIGRWEIPRESYPDGKTGYLNWRTDLAKFHAAKAGELMAEAGYDENFIIDVQKIVLKKKIKLDAEVQVMENALCLVFLEFQFEDFISKHAEDKLINILRKTWKKMNDAGHQAALTLSLSETAKSLIGKALS